MTVIGFTGTREGLTGAQVRPLTRIFVAFSKENRIIGTELHHGDCVGADAEADVLAYRLGFKITVHPPIEQEYRAWCKDHPRKVLPRRPYLRRNRDIVVACDVLVACPKEMTEPKQKRGGGTWATIRLAKRLGVTTIIVLPDGTIQ